MKAVGLIVEYNPLHNGHLHHIELARIKSNTEAVIAIMSGNFLQRGEPAIVDKFTRAKMAVEQGVDLVFELPTVYAIQHSDIFACAAVHILNQLQVESIVFGSEQGDITAFINLDQALGQAKDHYQIELKHQLNAGNSYPKANQLAVETLFPELDFDLNQPNNILGLSYLKAQKKINPNLKIDTIKRIQADYHQPNLSAPITSATSIRAQLSDSIEHLSHEKLSMPLASFQLLTEYQKQAGTFHQWELYFPYLKYRIISDSLEQLRDIHGMTEGLEYRLKSMINQATSFQELIDMVQTKRYTKTRLQRLFIHILLQLSKDQVQDEINRMDQINEFRLLAMTKKGQMYLNKLKNNADIKIISQLKRDLATRFLIDEKASSLYYLPLDGEKQLKFRQLEFQPPQRMHID